MSRMTPYVVAIWFAVVSWIPTIGNSPVVARSETALDQLLSDMRYFATVNGDTEWGPEKKETRLYFGDFDVSEFRDDITVRVGSTKITVLPLSDFGDGLASNLYLELPPKQAVLYNKSRTRKLADVKIMMTLRWQRETSVLRELPLEVQRYAALEFHSVKAKICGHAIVFDPQSGAPTEIHLDFLIQKVVGENEPPNPQHMTLND